MAVKDISDYDCCVAAALACGSLRTGDVLIYRTGQPSKVCLRAIERAISRGYLDSGVSDWTAFLTSRGRALLDEVGL